MRALYGIQASSRVIWVKVTLSGIERKEDNKDALKLFRRRRKAIRDGSTRSSRPGCVITGSGPRKRGVPRGCCVSYRQEPFVQETFRATAGRLGPATHSAITEGAVRLYPYRPLPPPLSIVRAGIGQR